MKWLLIVIKNYRCSSFYAALRSVLASLSVLFWLSCFGSVSMPHFESQLAAVVKTL